MKYARLTKKEKLIATTTKGPVYSNVPERDELYNRLAELEDKIEDGTLVFVNKDTCVYCGDEVPEGRQICPNCEENFNI